jgi:hypothetical protein
VRTTFAGWLPFAASPLRHRVRLRFASYSYSSVTNSTDGSPAQESCHAAPLQLPFSRQVRTIRFKTSKSSIVEKCGFAATTWPASSTLRTSTRATLSFAS